VLASTAPPFIRGQDAIAYNLSQSLLFAPPSLPVRSISLAHSFNPSQPCTRYSSHPHSLSISLSLSLSITNSRYFVSHPTNVLLPFANTRTHARMHTHAHTRAHSPRPLYVRVYDIIKPAGCTGHHGYQKRTIAFCHRVRMCV